MEEIEKIINNIKKQNELKYGFAVFDVKAKEVKGSLVFTGRVISESQKTDIFSAVEKFKTAFVDKVKVLSDPNVSPLGWCLVKRENLSIKNRFVSEGIINEKILGRITIDFLDGGEVLRVLFKNNDQLLVQRSDLTVGWVDRSGVIIKNKSLKKEWILGVHAKNGKVIAVNGSAERVVEEAKKYLGVKYVWSRKSKNGLDCSALTQTAFREAFDIIMPRHSWDQKKMGISVSQNEIKSGDLIFMLKLSNGHRHVGIADYSEGELKIVHACLAKRKVIRQDWEEVLKSYEVVEIKRIIEGKK